MRNLLLITQPQFGYLVDYYQYCNFLRTENSIQYLCWDYNRPKFELEGVKVIYVSRSGNLFKRNLRFLRAAMKFVRCEVESETSVLISYFRGCSILALLSFKWNNLFMDIRTAGVHPSKVKRLFYDNILLIESKFFKNISVVSKHIRSRLNLPDSTKIIPLGANLINIGEIETSELNLIYVGILSNRGIEKTIDGVAYFIKKFPDYKISYKIIGSGDEITVQTLKQRIEKNNLDKVISLLGYIKNTDLPSFYNSSNIGVSFVPKTPYFNFQPVTKTFEYLMAGLPVLATDTLGNREIINETNGILINDDATSFCDGIKKLSENLNNYESKTIKSSVQEFQWENIVLDLLNYLSIKDNLKS